MRLVLYFAIIFSLLGCFEKKIERRDGMFYEKISGKPLNMKGTFTGEFANKGKGEIKEGKLIGKWKFYHDNGEIFEVSHWDNNAKNGPATQWYQNGSKRLEAVWEDGKLISCSVWKPNGEKCTSTKIDNGDGVIVFYNDESQEVGKIYFKNGMELSF